MKGELQKREKDIRRRRWLETRQKYGGGVPFLYTHEPIKRAISHKPLLFPTILLMHFLTYAYLIQYAYKTTVSWFRVYLRTR